MNNFETFGKSKVDEDEVMYTVNTNDVRVYLQKKVDRICDALKANGGESMKVTINLISEKFGRAYVPFVIVLPESVEDRASNSTNIPEALRPNDDDDGVRLKKPFYQLLANYCYDNNDRKSLNAHNIVKQLGLYPHATREVQALMRPRREEFGDTRYVLLLLDPLRLFKDYLRNKNNPSEKFEPYIERCQKISDDGGFEYKIKKNRKKQDSFKRKDLHRRLARSIQKTKD